MEQNVTGMPEEGLSKDQILGELTRRKTGDADWRHGRKWSMVYYAGDEHADALTEAYRLYFAENAASTTAFPSLARLEAEIVAIVLSLLGGRSGEVGVMTSGGTESILLAMLAYREQARQRGIRAPYEIVLPASAHPAFLKAAHYFGLEPVQVRLGRDYRADPGDMKRKLSDHTICVVASAPGYPQGVVDPIEEIGSLAMAHGTGLHVDACLGGFFLPFMRMLGEPVPGFDFQVPGVTSISADLHKNGYSAKGASAVLYKTPELRSCQFFATADWPSGLYGSVTMLGTRSGGAVAAAWAAVMRLGRQGYLDLTRRALAVSRELVAGIDEIGGLEILGDPVMTVLSFRSLDVGIVQVAKRLSARGWHIDVQAEPQALHMIATAHHEQAVKPFLVDLRAAVTEAHEAPETGSTAVPSLGYGIDVELEDATDLVAYLRRNLGRPYDLESWRL